jgi:hypothetical protein
MCLLASLIVQWLAQFVRTIYRPASSTLANDFCTIHCFLDLIVCTSFLASAAKMTASYIVGSLVGSFAIAYLCDTFVSDKKAFGGECNLVDSCGNPVSTPCKYGSELLHSFWTQVPPPILFLTRSGGKQRTPSSRLGLALPAHRLS